MVSCRKAFSSTVEALAAQDNSIFVIASDSRGSVTVGGFAERLPAQFIEVGIAEQNAVSIAAGMALAGKTVFVTGPACFLSARSYEQVKVDVAYNKTDVKIIGVSAGVSYGPLGGTHTSLHDYAGFRALPNLEIFAPSDSIQTQAITRYLAQSGKPAYMRTGRGDVEAIYNENEAFDIHKAKMVCNGTDVTLIACGETVWYAQQAAIQLANKQISVRVLDMFCLKPVDETAVITAAKETKFIVTIEEHSIFGGLGEMVCGITAKSHPVPVITLGFPDDECKIGKSNELFAHYGLNTQGIINTVLKQMGR